VTRKRVDQALTALMKEPRRGPATGEQTVLGAPLRRGETGVDRVDLSGFRVLSGLAQLAAGLADEVLEQATFGYTDVMVQKQLVPREVPELTGFGLAWLCFYGRFSIVDRLVNRWEAFRRHLEGVLLAIQTPRWGRALFPGAFEVDAERASSSAALLFPFHLDVAEYIVLVEHERGGHFLRVTLEDAGEMRLRLAHIAHTVVAPEAMPQPIGDALAAGEAAWAAVERALRDHCAAAAVGEVELPGVFDRVRRLGFPELGSVVFHIDASDASALLDTPPTEGARLLATQLMVLADPVAGEVLRAGRTLEVVCGERRAFLDSSQRDRCINVALGSRRDLPTLDRYLDTMPRLRALATAKPGVLAGVRVVLIHHNTGEVLATMKALELLGCAFLHVHFVQYAGVVPRDILEALLALPEDRFRTRSLQRVDVPGVIEGKFSLSDRYSSIVGLEALDARLQEKRPSFLGAMRMSALQLFLAEATQARERGEALLLVEDGGYLAPILNRACLEGLTCGELLVRLGIDGLVPGLEAELPVEELLDGVLPGTVEHTRNGHDDVAGIERAFGRLRWPACSIAISEFKREDEAWQVSLTMLNAVESVLFGGGFVLTSRRPLILGSAGAIGSKLMRDVASRLGDAIVCGVDIAPMPEALRGDPFHCAHTLAELTRELLLDVDLVLGVVGASVMTTDVIEDLVLNGTRPALFFASGSTKTVEFSHLQRWLDDLLANPDPRIGGAPVRIEVTPVKAPQTAFVVASRVRLVFEGRPARDLYLLAGLMPVNFLYYGVPTETMDVVLTQLVQVTTGLVDAWRAGRPLPPRLLAVDRDIDADANVLATV
jgi:hypothetical protein